MSSIDICWDFPGSVDFVLSNAFKKVALQFPDNLLKDAHTVYQELRRCLQAQDESVEVRAQCIAQAWCERVRCDLLSIHCMTVSLTAKRHPRNVDVSFMNAFHHILGILEWCLPQQVTASYGCGKNAVGACLNAHLVQNYCCDTRPWHEAILFTLCN
jgi:hypothetical protein